MLASTRPYEACCSGKPDPSARLPACIGTANEPGRSESRESDDRHSERQSTQYRSTGATSSSGRKAACRVSLTDEITVTSVKQSGSGPENARVVVYEGNVDIRIGTYRLQADRATVYDAENRVVAEGSVVFDQADQQRITGSRAEWNYRTKTGYFDNSTGFTNQTQDGTRIYFTADRVEKVSLDTIVAINVQITACDEDVPKWSFQTSKATIKTGDRVYVRSPTTAREEYSDLLSAVRIGFDQAARSRFGIFDTDLRRFRCEGRALVQLLTIKHSVAPLISLFAATSTPSAGSDSAVNCARARTRGRISKSGFYAVKDRIFGPEADATHPDQGGSSLYVDGVHYFQKRFHRGG